MRVRFLFLFSLLATTLCQSAAWAESDRFLKVDAGERNKICMVNDFYNPMADFSKFSVDIDGKSYYGCCNGCKKRLSSSDQYHYAQYSVNGKQVKVDKATAGCILADKQRSGATYYFENEQACNDFVKNPDAYTFSRSSEHH